MAYQNVGTPRFYINQLEWGASLGVITLPHDVFRTLPVKIQSPPSGEMVIPPVFGYFGVLDYYLMGLGVSGAGFEAKKDNVDVNSDWLANDSREYDGWYLHKIVEMPDIIDFHTSESGAVGNFGSIVMGTYYDMPHSPDLSLTMTREYGGIKTMETKGGASLSNSFYNGSPKWGSLGAWELSSGTTSNQALSRSGRRVWNLSFSYLDDGDVFGSNQLLLTQGEAEGYEPVYTTEGYSGELIGTEAFQQNLLTHDNFFSQVIHKTNGGQLPFIFQPDGGGGVAGQGNFNPDQFAICKFDSGFKFEQVANGVYNMKLKIREVW